MGRIVIPRVRQEARQQLQRKRRTGYFANGFGPQEMRLVSQLADLAVAGGGQIARAVQISNLEKEQAAAQAEYDQRLQSEIESRQRAAQAEIDDASVSGQVEAFFAQQEPPSVRERLPSLSSMSLQSDLVQPRPTPGGPLSPGVLARPGVLAPEDLSMARAQMAARLQPDTMVSAMQRPDVAAVFDLGEAAGLEAVEDAMRRGVIDPVGMPMTSVDEAEGIMDAASMRAYSDALQRLEQLDRQGVQESVRRLSSPLVPQEQMLDLVSRYDFSPDALERMAQRSADYSSYTPEQMVAAGVSLPAAPSTELIPILEAQAEFDLAWAWLEPNLRELADSTVVSGEHADLVRRALRLQLRQRQVMEAAETLARHGAALPESDRHLLRAALWAKLARPESTLAALDRIVSLPEGLRAFAFFLRAWSTRMRRIVVAAMARKWDLPFQSS